jgi:hypothetical protein
LAYFGNILPWSKLSINQSINQKSLFSGMMENKSQVNLRTHNYIPLVSTYLHDFEDFFSKSLFDCLSDCKIWDHVIELVPDGKALNCKVYPLTPNQQAKLDDNAVQCNSTTGPCPLSHPLQEDTLVFFFLHF